MKNKFNPWYLVMLIGMFLMLTDFQLSAQKPRGGGGKAPSRPAPSRPAPSSKPKSISKPSAAKKPTVPNKQSVGNKPSAQSKSSSIKKPDNSGLANKVDGGDRKTNVSNSGNKTNNIGSNNKKVNIDNSKKNVNVNVDKSRDVHINNSRNTSVRRNNRSYGRPPYVYGGRRYRCYRPFSFHPYRPFMWGPMWHPWGFFVATLATTAIICSFADNDMPADINLAMDPVLNNGNYSGEMQPVLSGPYSVSYTDFQEYYTNTVMNAALSYADEYYYDQGVFYLKGDGGYTVVAAPLGALIKTLPTGYETITLDDNTKNYYYGGAFFEKVSSGYKVVAPLAGSLVENISEGGEEVKIGDVTYVKFGDTYFQPVQENGKDMYEVADVEDDK